MFAYLSKKVSLLQILAWLIFLSKSNSRVSLTQTILCDLQISMPNNTMLNVVAWN